MKLSIAERETLRMMFKGNCAYCGCELKRGWHADHIEAVYRKVIWVPGSMTPDGWKHGKLKQTGELHSPENDRIDNLFPSCRTCNSSKSSYSLESWRQILSEQPRMARDYSHNYRWALKFGLVIETNVPVVFYFERLAVI